MKKTLSIILCIAMLMSSISVCFPAFAIDVDFGVESAKDLAIEAVPEAAALSAIVEPISATGYDGKLEDVNPLYPGAYFKFDTEIDADTLTKTNLNNSAVKYFEYDAANKTIILFQDAKNLRAGMTVSFAAFDTNVKTVGGDTVSFPAISYTLAEHVNTGDNLIPYGGGISSYPGAYADTSYTLSVNTDTNEIVSKTTLKSNFPAFALFNLPYEDGATYKASFTLRVQKAITGKTTFKVNPSWYYDGDGSAATHTDGMNHVLPAITMDYNDATKTYTNSYEVTVGTVNDRTAEMALRLYVNTPIRVGSTQQTNPTIAITDVSAYQRLDVVYESGDYCELIDDEAAPERTAGVYLDGSADDTTVTLISDMPYEVNDDRWYIDEEKPWIDEEGNEYAAGAVVDLAEVNKTLVLTPNVKTDEDIFTLTFVHDQLSKFPNNISVFSGETVDVTKYNDALSNVTGKRFAGWMNEKGKIVDTIVMTKDITLTPYLTVNYDFAFADSYTGTAINTMNATKDYKFYEGNMIAAVDLQAGQDAFLQLGNFELATAKYNAVKVWFDAYSKDETVATYVPSFVGSFEGMYINTGTSYNADGETKLISGTSLLSAKLVSEDGKQYLVVTFDGAKYSKWNGTLHYMRIDPPNGKPDWAVRRVEFVENEQMKETEIKLEGLESISAGDVAPTAKDIAGIADVKSIEWTPALLKGDIIDANTVYAAKVTFVPKAGAGKIFNNETIVKMGNMIVPSTMTDNAEVTINLSFPRTADVATHTVTFDNTGLNEAAPASATAFDGKPFPAYTYYDNFTAVNTAKHFLGWATEPGLEHFEDAPEYITITEDTTLYPVIGYGYNFAVPGFSPQSTGYSLEYLFQGKYLKVNSCGKDYNIMLKTNIPGSMIKGIKVYYDPEFYSKAPDTIYFLTNKDGSWNETKAIRGTSDKGIDEKTGYYYLTFMPGTPSAVKDKISNIRFDVFTNAFTGDPAYVRAFDFIYNDAVDADTVHFAGIPAPVAGVEDTTAANIQIGDTYAEFDHVEWTPELSMNQTTVGRFEENTDYTAKVFFKPVVGSRFNTEGMKIYNSATDETVDASYDEDTGCIYAEFNAGTTKAYNNFGMTIVGEDFYLIDGMEHTYKVVFSGNPLDKKFSVEFSVPSGEVADYADCMVNTIGNPVINVRKPCDLTIKVVSAYNPDVTAEFTVTTACMEFEAYIEGPDSIGKASRLTAYRMLTVSEDPIYDKTATWSVDDTSLATIDAKTGKLVPIANGFVTITAVSNYDPTVSCTKVVEITNQSATGTIVYNAGAQDPTEVSGLPAPEDAYGTVTLSSVIPVREGYSFLGWAENDETMVTVNEVTVPSEAVVNVYAVWAKGIFYNFNGVKEGVTGFSVGGKNEQITDTYWSYTNAANDTRFTVSGISIDPKKYRTVQIRLATDASAGSSKIYYKGTKDDKTYGFDALGMSDGKAYGDAENMALTVTSGGQGIDVWETLNFNFYNTPCGTTPATWYQGEADTIIRMDFQLSQGRVGAENRIDYIAILDSSSAVKFDKNTEDEVANMPADMDVGQGDSITVLETPIRDGYKFMGWSKYATDRSVVKTTFTIVGDTTLYAIWDKTVDVENEEESGETVSKLGDIDPNADGEAILVLTDAPKGTKVTFTYTDNGGDTHTINATTNAKGYAIIDLDGIADKAYDSKLSMNSNYSFKEVTVTNEDTAKSIANKVDQTRTGGGSGSFTPPSSTVTDVPSDKQAYDPATMNTGDEEGGVTFVDAMTMSKEEGDILYNFDSEKNADLFNSYRQVSMNGISDSVLHLTANGLKSGSNDSPAFTTCNLAVNADTHPYIVVKAKQSGLTNKTLRIYFQEEGGKFAEAKALSQNLGDSYTMMVYDMTQFAEWKGKITRFMFSFNGDVKGDCDIDWILFTSEVPASIDDIDGTHEMFPDVVTGEFPFTDVKNSDWFYSEVNNAYRKGFVKGMTATTYEPDGNVTIAEAITMAIRLNYAFNGKEDDIKVIEGAEWYPNYVNAAVKAGIIKNNQFADYDVPALRKEVAMIMYKAVPSSYLTSINMFTSIPDCDKKDPSYSAIIKLYNAGIVQGSDAEYNFYPNTNITRAEMAAILNRIALPQNRKRIVTEAEKESKKIKLYTDDIVSGAQLGNCEGTKLVAKNGAAWAMAKTKDPIVYLTNLVPNLNGKEVSKIHVGMKWDATKIPNPTNAGARIFFTTPSGGWAEARSLKSAWDGQLDANGVADIVFDAKANAEFANTITAIRFDPFDSINEFSITYVIIE